LLARYDSHKGTVFPYLPSATKGVTERDISLGNSQVAFRLKEILFADQRLIEAAKSNRHGHRDARCPLYPQKRTSELSREMSALCHSRRYGTADAQSLDVSDRGFYRLGA
jgi:hypothetical protein